MTDLAYSFDSIKAMLDEIDVSAIDQAEAYRNYESPRTQKSQPMLSDQPGPLKYLKAILVEEIGLSEKSATRLIEEHGELDVQRHAMCCLWMMDQGKVHVPPA
jgi:hypothetical protein